MSEGWVENEISDGINIQTIRSFSPPENPAVRMELFYRGLPVSEDAGASFRKILKLAPKVIFNRQIKSEPTTVETQCITELIEVLGNVGNNQITNKQIGFRGPAFILNRLEVLPWSGKPLITTRGYFQDPENNNMINEFYGFFIDADPNDTACNIEEIYLEAATEELYKQYLPAFKQSLNSIQWLSV